MRLMTFETGGTTRLGLQLGSQTVHLTAAGWDGPATMLDLLGAEPRWMERLRGLASELAERAAAGRPVPGALAADSVRLLSPLPRPAALYAVAQNYIEHQKEGNTQIIPKEQAVPWFFLKPTTTVIGPEAPIALPDWITEQADWECELVVVIGPTARRVGVDQALQHVAGYTVGNDISARSLKMPPQRIPRPRDTFHDWLHGKWCDGFGALGPALVTADEVPDPQQLPLRLRYNGETRQEATTGDMIFTVAELVSFLSQIATLEPGTMIMTGTPSGVGRTTGTFLKPGDRLEAEIDGIGLLGNPIVAGA